MITNRCKANVLAALTNLFLAWRQPLATPGKGEYCAKIGLLPVLSDQKGAETTNGRTWSTRRAQVLC
jgi:hypothetical protein